MKKLLFLFILLFSFAANANSDYSVKYTFPEKPKVGQYVFKVNVLKNGKNFNDAIVVAVADMPSMRGHHASKATLQLNKKGDYLAPLQFAMPGQWEVLLSVKVGEEEIFLEAINVEI